MRLELSFVVIGQICHSAGFEMSSSKLLKWLSLICATIWIAKTH